MVDVLWRLLYHEIDFKTPIEDGRIVPPPKNDQSLLFHEHWQQRSFSQRHHQIGCALNSKSENKVLEWRLYRVHFWTESQLSNTDAGPVHNGSLIRYCLTDALGARSGISSHFFYQKTSHCLHPRAFIVLRKKKYTAISSYGVKIIPSQISKPITCFFLS